MVNYGQAELTLKCIDSVKRSRDVGFKIVVIDNNSPDNSYQVLKSKLADDVVLIKSEKNNGFAAGNNIGIKYALNHNADFIMLLNNDTEIDENMIAILASYVDENTTVSPKMYYYDRPDTLWFAGGKYLKNTGRFVHVGENMMDSIKYSKQTQCDFLTGCCMMLSAKTIRKTGLLDEEYFMYMEDIDYSLRLKSNNIKLIMVPEAKLWHKIGSSSGGEKSKLAVYYGNRNRLFLANKFHFSSIIQFETLFSRFLLMVKGFLFNTNEKYIFLSISDFYKGKMKQRDDLKLFSKRSNTS